MLIKYSARLLAVGIFAIYCGSSLAVSSKSDMQLSPYLASEQYFWKESIPQKTNFLTESGNRYVFGLEYSNFNTRFRGMLIGVDARIYNGRVDYSGHAFSLTESNPELKPFDSSTRYFGNMIQLDGGYRLPLSLISQKAAVDVLFSLGSDFWYRSIGGGTLADGTKVSSYTENYHSMYTKVGIGLSLQTGSHKHQINFGLKRPFRVNETLDLGSLGAEVKLAPVPLVTSFVNWRIYPVIQSKRPFSLSMYFEQTKLSASEVQEFSFNLDGKSYQSALYQPDTHSTVTGIRFLWRI